LNAIILAFAPAVVFAQAASAPTPPSPASAPVAPAAAPPATTPASSVEYVIEGGAVVAVEGAHRQPVSIEGPVVALLREGSTLYVARGARGVTVWSVAEPLLPRRIRNVSVTGSATGFHVVDGQVWVVTVSRSAVPIDEAAASETAEPTRSSAATTAPAPPANAASRQEPSNVSILRVSPGTVELSAGAKDGVRVGDRFAIFRSRLIDGEGATGFTGEELVTVAEVVAVKEKSALAETGRTAVVQPKDQARRAKADQGDSIVFPPRVPNVGEVSVVLRPLVNAGSPLGFGILADLGATYWGSAYFAGVRVQPLGLGWTTGGSIVSTAALAEGGYDARALSVGLGAGVSWVNGDADHMLRSWGGSSDYAAVSGGPTVTQHQETHSAFTMSQLVRLGARDGLSLAVRNLLILHHDEQLDRTGFIYGGTTGHLAIPVGGRSDLFLEGGGGVMGYWFAGIGVSTWLVGNGSPGSWKLFVSAGAAGIFGSKRVTQTYPGSLGPYTYDQQIDVAGPMVSFGLARRFTL
jgi:hypothetical protein